MKIKLISYSKPTEEIENSGIHNAQELIAFCARVSNPSNQMNTKTSEKLIKYLIKHRHWSPLEMVSACVEIETTRDIARQLLRHTSFRFQEFCITGDSKITTGQYNHNKEFVVDYIKIQDLYERQNWNTYKDILIRVYDDNRNEFVATRLKEVFKTGLKLVYKLTLMNGKQIECTKEHKFLSTDGWDTLEKISGMSVIASEKIVLENPKKIAVDENGSLRKFVEIKSIEYVGEKETFDLEVEHSSHNYVANEICVHNSQRYADPTQEFAVSFQLRECRLQDVTNRQNSIKLDMSLAEHINLAIAWEKSQKRVLQVVEEEYKWAIANGIAKEQARAILPEGLTSSRVYVNATLRSYIHYIEVRSDKSTQQEHRDIAIALAEVLSKIFPIAKQLISE